MSKKSGTISEGTEQQTLSQELQKQLKVRGNRDESDKHLRLPFALDCLRKAAVGVIAILSALLVAEAIARSVICGLKPAQFGSQEFDAKMRVAGKPIPAGKPCIYFLGTSHSSRGIYADLIADRLCQSGFNIAVKNIACSGSYPKEQILILEHALKQASGPAMLIYECNQGGFTAAESITNQYGEHFAKSVYERNLHSDWPFLQKFDVWLKQNSYLVRYRNTLKERLTALPSDIFSPGESVWKRNPSVAIFSEISPCGWAPAYAMLNEKYLQTTINRRISQTDVFNPKAELKKKRARYFVLQNVFEFAKRHHIKTAMLWLPLHPQFQNLCNKEMNTDDEELKERMHTAARLDDAQLIDVHDYRIKQDFSDSDHLNASGAVEISKRIANMLLVKSDTFLKPLMEGAR